MSSAVKSVKVSQFALVQSIRFAAVAKDDQSSRYALGAICLDFCPQTKQLFVVGCDGRMLHWQRIDDVETNFEAETRWLLSLELVNYIKSLPTSNPRKVIEIVQTTNTPLATKCWRGRDCRKEESKSWKEPFVEGRFPKWEQVIPEAADNVVYGQAQSFAQMFEPITFVNFCANGSFISGKAEGVNFDWMDDLKSEGRVEFLVSPELMSRSMEAWYKERVLEIHSADKDAPILIFAKDEEIMKQGAVVMPSHDNRHDRKRTSRK